MDRLNKILDSKEYQFHIKLNEEAEKERLYCKHGLGHLLDVARIAYLINLEESLGFSKEIIYVTSILHDIGKYRQYKEGISHEIASEEIARTFYQGNDFTKEEQELIKQGILGHRDVGSTGFAALIYKADKMSRICQYCSQGQECNWDSKKKNTVIKF